MRQTGKVLAGVLLVALVLGIGAASVASADEHTCYFVPTQDKLVRVLFGAHEAGDGLIMQELTTGERWVLSTFFNLEAELLTGEAAALCNIQL